MERLVSQLLNKKINMIVAMGNNHEIGKDNKLLWHLPDDLKFFKMKTAGQAIVMGYNTFKSLPGILPNRKHIVLTSKKEKINGVTIVHNLDELFEVINEINEEIYIIGGAQIYRQLIDFVDTMYITKVDLNIEADTFFPIFDENEWNIKELGENENNKIEFKHLEYKRK